MGRELGQRRSFSGSQEGLVVQGRQDRQVVHATALWAQPDVHLWVKARAGKQGWEDRPAERAGAGCLETPWRDWSMVQLSNQGCKPGRHRSEAPVLRGPLQPFHPHVSPLRLGLRERVPRLGRLAGPTSGADASGLPTCRGGWKAQLDTDSLRDIRTEWVSQSCGLCGCLHEGAGPGQDLSCALPRQLQVWDFCSPGRLRDTRADCWHTHSWGQCPRQWTLWGKGGTTEHTPQGTAPAEGYSAAPSQWECPVYPTPQLRSLSGTSAPTPKEQTLPLAG